VPTPVASAQRSTRAARQGNYRFRCLRTISDLRRRGAARLLRRSPLRHRHGHRRTQARKRNPHRDSRRDRSDPAGAGRWPSR